MADEKAHGPADKAAAKAVKALEDLRPHVETLQADIDALIEKIKAAEVEPMFGGGGGPP